MVRQALHSLPVCVILLMVTCATLVQVTTARPGPRRRSRSGCPVQEKCTTPYERRERDDELKLCASLKLYRLCLDRYQKPCRSESKMAIYYLTVRSLIPVLMRNNHCNNVSLPKNESDMWNIFRKPSTPQPNALKTTERPQCISTRIYSESVEKRYCGLFGDPHLRTFYDATQTCVVEGAWTLIDNKYLVVQVTNVPLVRGSSATATSKITVIINEHEGSCVKQKIYKAQSNSLPAGFDDGTSTTGSSECSVRIVEVEKDSLIKIRLCHIQTDIFVRQVGQYLTFHIRMPHEIANSHAATGLCVRGCPKHQIIDYRELLSYTERRLTAVLPKKKVTRREAKTKCKNSNVAGFYLDSCMFDLLTTGDSNFALAAKSALDDAFVMDPIGTVRDLRNYNITVPKPDMVDTGTQTKHKNNTASSNGPYAPANSLIAVLCTVLFLGYLTPR